MEFVKCIHDSFLKHNAETPTREGAVLDLIRENEEGQVTEGSAEKHFGKVTIVQ